MRAHGYRCSVSFGLGLGPALTLASAFAATPVTYLEGNAYSSNGRLLYREAHWSYADASGPSRLVLYRCPDGQPFARKTLHEHDHPQSPDFALTDAQLGYHEGVRSEAGTREVFVQRSARAAEHSAPLGGSPLPVIDAGFDAYVQAHWDTLGKHASAVPFLVPSRLRSYDVNVQRMADASLDGRATRQYRISLSSWIAFALPHVDVTYDAATRQLRRLQGLASIRDANGSNVDVRVDYPPATRRPASQTEVSAASEAALNGRCSLR